MVKKKVLIIIIAAPFFSEGLDAKFIALLFGSFGAGAMLSNLINSIKGQKEKTK